MKRTSKLSEGWLFRPQDASGSPIGDWRAVPVPSAWERYPGAWNHRGSARYRVTIPKIGDPGRQRWLRFSGVQYNCRIYFNGDRLGVHEGGWDPFWIPLPESANTGGALELVVEGIGPALPETETTAGFLPDCGIMPSGIWGPVHLVETGSAVIEGALLQWIPSREMLKVTPVLKRLPGENAVRVFAELRSADGEPAARIETPRKKGAIALTVSSPHLWRLQDPYLYTLAILAEDGEGGIDRWETRVGLKTFTASGSRLLLNGEPIMLRGILHWGYDPVTLAPGGDEKNLRKEILRLKAFGFNMVKHCLYVPQDVYFRLCDELGMLQWLELPLWLPSGSDALMRRVVGEYPRIISAAQHHPSIALYSLGCELNNRVEASFLRKLHRVVKGLTPNGLLCDNSGSGDCYGAPEMGISDFYDYHFYAEPCHLSGLMASFGASWRPEKPWIFGEFCDSDAYRNLEEVRTSLPEAGRWWLSKDPEKNRLLDKSRVQRELGCLYQEERLGSRGLCGQAERLAAAACRHSMTHRKQTVEVARRFPRTSGYVITGIRDTAITTSGVFDDLGRPRFDRDHFKRINDDHLLLLLPPPRRAWVHGGDRPSGFDLHHQTGGSLFSATLCGSLFGPCEPGPPDMAWRLLTEEGAVTLFGSIPIGPKRKAGLNILGTLGFTLPQVKRTVRFTLELAWPLKGGCVSNAWPIWVHPASFSDAVETLHLHDPSGRCALLEGLNGGEKGAVWVTPVLDTDVLRRLDQGGAVILVQYNDGPLQTVRLPFWREAILLKEDHPLADRFPFQDGGGEELLSLTTDRFFTGRLGNEGFQRMESVLTRLDARAFTFSFALAELHGFPGRCLATTLSLAGGTGDLPLGLRNNRAGKALLAAMLEELAG